MRPSLVVTTIAMALLIPAVSGAQPAEPVAAPTAESVLIVPFGVNDIATVKLAAALTEALGALFTDRPSFDAQVAKAPRVDILTLIECSEATDDCLGALATTLGVDRAILGELIADASGGWRASVVIARGDGTFERLSIPLPTQDLETQVDGFRRALAPRFGIDLPAPTPAPVADATVDPFAAPIEPTPPPMSAGGQPIDQPRRWSFRKVRPAAWITGGVGIVAFGTGLGFYAKSKSTERDIENAPTITAEHIASLRELEDRGDRQRTLGGTLLLAGGVATAVGLGLIIWDGSREDADGGLSGVMLVPSQSGAVATMGGTF